MFEKIKKFYTENTELDKQLKQDFIKDITKFLIYTIIVLIAFYLAHFTSDFFYYLYWDLREKYSTELVLITFYTFGFFVNAFMISFEFFSDLYKDYLSSKQK